jgi:hypothetical protein
MENFMKRYLIAATLLAIPATAITFHAAHTQMPDSMSQHMRHGRMSSGTFDLATPTMPGQDAFGTIQEIVRILESDPKTDWSKVDLEALRQHLIDMNDVTLKSDAKTAPVDGGITVTVTGAGRAVAAIQRMVPAHAAELNKMNGWRAKAEKLPDGVRLTVTAGDPAQVIRIRGLGFIGLMVSGAHHQPHHLAMAKGEFVHTHN